MFQSYTDTIIRYNTGTEGKVLHKTYPFYNHSPKIQIFFTISAVNAALFSQITALYCNEKLNAL
jgi:hypothetical protein